MRVNDVGGIEGFGRIAVVDDEEPFHADWEAHVYAINVALLRRGLYTLDEFRDAVERMAPAEYVTASYYARWLSGIRRLLHEKGVIDATGNAGSD